MKQLLVVAALVGGCSIDSGAKQPPPVQQAQAPVSKAAPPAPPSKAPRQDHGGAPGDIKWAGPVKWRSWEEGLAEAKQGNRGICLVVYADWCPRCKELAPVFAQPDVVALADKLVMIRQDADDAAPWMAQFEKFGGYVPRIFFLKPDGTVREDLNSGHPRYPYFYTPGGVDKLKASMQRAAEG